jgi:lipopolysaccharide/colanic/teichoic acid biosynthesis glycosyltransferase
LRLPGFKSKSAKIVTEQDMQEFETQAHRPPSLEEVSVFHGQGYQRLKRVCDLLLALILLLAVSLLMLLIAIGTKLHSPGPIFYRQTRIGKDGKPFTMLKFRSMRINSDHHVHREHVQRLIREGTDPKVVGVTSLKLKVDPRITGLGRILRKLSLDELPQLINVVRGEMSLVGPRPPLPYEYELYQDWHKQRLSVLPGMTGLWQITARNQVSFDEMVRIDLAYIQSMSLSLDLLILLRTPLEMVYSKGAG